MYYINFSEFVKFSGNRSANILRNKKGINENRIMKIIKCLELTRFQDLKIQITDQVMIALFTFCF